MRMRLCGKKLLPRSPIMRNPLVVISLYSEALDRSSVESERSVE